MLLLYFHTFIFWRQTLMRAWYRYFQNVITVIENFFHSHSLSTANKHCNALMRERYGSHKNCNHCLHSLSIANTDERLMWCRLIWISSKLLLHTLLIFSLNWLELSLAMTEWFGYYQNRTDWIHSLSLSIAIIDESMIWLSSKLLLEASLTLFIRKQTSMRKR